MKKMILVISFFTAIQPALIAQKKSAAGDFFYAQNSSTTGMLKASLNYPLTDSSIVKDHAFYMQRSRNQKTAGLVLLGSGVLLSGIGLIISTRNDASFDQTETGVIIMGVGAAAGIASIPLMIMAHANRNKAKLMLSNQATGYGIPFKSGELTGVTLSVALGR